jgi:hypothetical protein
MDTSVSWYSFLKMEEDVSAKIVRAMALISLWISLGAILVGVLLCIFGEDRDKGIGLVVSGVGLVGIVSSYLLNGLNYNSKGCLFIH